MVSSTKYGCSERALRGFGDGPTIVDMIPIVPTVISICQWGDHCPSGGVYEFQDVHANSGEAIMLTARYGFIF